MKTKMWLLIINTIVLCLLISSIALGEAHIFLGKWKDNDIPQQLLVQKGHLPVKIEDTYIVYGDNSEQTDETEVRFSGDEVDFKSHSVCLSCKPILLGGKGTIEVEFTGQLSLVEVVFWDESRYEIPFVDGADLDFSCQSGDAGMYIGLKKLTSCRLGGNTKMRGKFVHQFFRPWVSGSNPPVGQKWVFKIQAEGNEEFNIYQISIYDNLPTELSMSPDCKLNGYRSEVMIFGWEPLYDRFKRFVLNNLTSSFESNKEELKQEKTHKPTIGPWNIAYGDWKLDDLPCHNSTNNSPSGNQTFVWRKVNESSLTITTEFIVEERGQNSRIGIVANTEGAIGNNYDRKWSLTIDHWDDRNEETLKLLEENVAHRANIPYHIHLGTRYRMKMGIDGNFVRGKVWEADQTEPDWMVEDRFEGPYNKYGIGLYSEAAKTCFRAFGKFVR